MPKPNFFILGAPKCGTTSLAYWLGQHPNCFFSPVKEPHFFNTDVPGSIIELDKYEQLFRDASPEHYAIGEGSTHYLSSAVAVPKIREYAPEARFIVCLRNPIEMAPAFHGERLKQGRENVRSFKKAWYLQETRAAGRKIPRNARTTKQRLQYGDYCKLGKLMQRLYNTVPPERVLCVLLEDMTQDPRLEYERVLQFLGLPTEDQICFDPMNSSVRVKSSYLRTLTRAAGDLKHYTGFGGSTGFLRRLNNINMKNAKRGPMDETLQRELRCHFREDIMLLSDLLSRNLSHWIG